MIEEKKEALRREIARRERELERLESIPDLDALVEGSVVAFTVRFGYREASRPYVFVGYKTGELWFLTGERGPNGVSSDALGEWLATGGRTLVSATTVAQVTVEKVDLGQAMAEMLAALAGE